MRSNLVDPLADLRDILMASCRELDREVESGRSPTKIDLACAHIKNAVAAVEKHVESNVKTGVCGDCGKLTRQLPWPKMVGDGPEVGISPMLAGRCMSLMMDRLARGACTRCGEPHTKED